MRRVAAAVILDRTHNHLEPACCFSAHPVSTPPVPLGAILPEWYVLHLPGKCPRIAGQQGGPEKCQSNLCIFLVSLFKKCLGYYKSFRIGLTPYMRSPSAGGIDNTICVQLCSISQLLLRSIDEIPQDDGVELDK